MGVHHPGRVGTRVARRRPFAIRETRTLLVSLEVETIHLDRVDEMMHQEDEERTDTAEEEENPAEERQERKERVEKPGPDTIDQDQDDSAHEKQPLDTPR